MKIAFSVIIVIFVIVNFWRRRMRQKNTVSAVDDGEEEEVESTVGEEMDVWGIMVMYVGNLWDRGL